MEHHDPYILAWQTPPLYSTCFWALFYLAHLKLILSPSSEVSMPRGPGGPLWIEFLGYQIAHRNGKQFSVGKPPHFKVHDGLLLWLLTDRTLTAFHNMPNHNTTSYPSVLRPFLLLFLM